MIQGPHTLPIEIRVLDPRIHDWGLPRHHSAMAAGIDLFACVDGPLSIDADTPAQLIPAGIAIHIGVPGYAALIVPRSGMGHRTGLVMGNLIGVLDGDYMGPVMISAWNRNAPGTSPIVIQPGDRIAQMMFVPVARPAFTVVDAFSQQSARGEAGFGSTG
jgi:dUTP pyrophosphatase